MKTLEELEEHYTTAKRAWIDAIAKGYSQKSIDALESAKVDAWLELEVAKQTVPKKKVHYVRRLDK